MAGEDDDGPAGCPGCLDHASGDFADERLFVVAALAGDDEVGGGEPFVEAGEGGDDFEAAGDGGAEEGVKAAREAAGGASSGEGAEVDAGEAPGDGSEALQRLFEELDFGGRGAFLGREEAGSAGWAAEG